MLLCRDPKCCVLRAVDFAQILPIARQPDLLRL